MDPFFSLSSLLLLPQKSCYDSHLEEEKSSKFWEITSAYILLYDLTNPMQLKQHIRDYSRLEVEALAKVGG